MFAKQKKGKPKTDAAADAAAEEEERLKAELEGKQRAEEEAARQKKAEEEAAAAAAAEKKAVEKAEAKKKAEEEAEAKRKAEEEAEAAAKRMKEEQKALRAKEEAASREKAAEKRSKIRHQRWLGAPPPEDVQGPMTMGSFYDMKVAFTMIDKKGRGYLERKQARNFCRCAGWILPDRDLDMMLDGTLGHVAKLLGTGGTRPTFPNKTFTLEELCDILEANSQGANGRLKDVTESLTRLASQNGQVRRNKFQEVVAEAPDITVGDVELILQMVGLPRASDMDCKDLGTRLLDSVCGPPTSVDTSKQSAKKQNANPMSLYRSS